MPYVVLYLFLGLITAVRITDDLRQYRNPTTRLTLWLACLVAWPLFWVRMHR